MAPPSSAVPVVSLVLVVPLPLFGVVALADLGAIGDSSFGSLCTRDGGAFGVSTTLGDLGIFGYFPAFFDSTGNFCGTDAPSSFFFFFFFFNFFIAPLFFLFCFVTT